MTDLRDLIERLRAYEWSVEQDVLRQAADELQSLSERIDELEGALRHISGGCGMLSQPAALNAPEIVWLRRQLKECERIAFASITMEG